MKDIKREYKIDNSIYFNSKFGEKVLSNMYPCKLTYDGETFNSVEQMFHVLLYRFLEAKTMKCKTSFECKEVYNTYVMEKKEKKGKNESDEKGVFVGGNICGRSMMAVREEYREGKLKID